MASCRHRILHAWASMQYLRIAYNLHMSICINITSLHKHYLRQYRCTNPHEFDFLWSPRTDLVQTFVCIVLYSVFRHRTPLVILVQHRVTRMISAHTSHRNKSSNYQRSYDAYGSCASKLRGHTSFIRILKTRAHSCTE
jgi:hypothetical protein